MKRVIQCLLLAFLFSSSAAKADDWGCEVVMCLANPAGPMAASACQPPIQRLFAALSKKKPDPMPTCESANGAAVAKQGFNYFDPCPAGSTTLQAGERALQVTRAVFTELSKHPVYLTGFGIDVTAPGGPMQSYMSAAHAGNLNWGGVKNGLGTGEGIAVTSTNENKVCVSGSLGPVYLPDNGQWVPIPAFERVTTLDKAASPRYIDVFVDGKLFNRVRF